MKKNALLAVAVAGLLSGCNFQTDEVTKLRADIESLKKELGANREAFVTLQEVGFLLDSIDSHRADLRDRMSGGTSMTEYTNRMRDINRYVGDVQKKIAALEKSVAVSNASTAVLQTTIQQAKRQLEARNRDIGLLQNKVAQYHNQNDNLIQTVTLQKSEITEKLTQLEATQNEIKQLENQVKDLLARSQSDEADAYFARARAVEEKANRTKFAPKKKKETRKEALELYKLAATLGKEEAREKVTELESLI